MTEALKDIPSIWRLICDQPGIGLTVYDAFGICRFMDIHARQIYLGYPGNGEDPTNKSIEDLEGKSLASERIGLVTQVLSNGQPVALRQIYGGKNIEATYWNTGEALDGTPLVLSITRFVSSVEQAPPNSIPFVESQYLDLGELDCLSDKELMVLTLIGKGMPLKRIASQLSTPIRTIENRRSSLGRKLSADSLVALAIIAHNAGLEQRHSTLTRVVRRRVDTRHTPNAGTAAKPATLATTHLDTSSTSRPGPHS